MTPSRSVQNRHLQSTEESPGIIHVSGVDARRNQSGVRDQIGLHPSVHHLTAIKEDANKKVYVLMRRSTVPLEW